MDIDEYENKIVDDYADSTLQSRLTALRNLENFTNTQKPTESDIVEWIDEINQALAAGTVSQYFDAVEDYFDVLYDEDISHLRTDLPSYEPTNTTVYLTYGEWKVLEKNTRIYRDKALFQIMYTYARVPNEVLLMNLEDVDLENESIRLYHTTTEPNQRTQSYETTDSTYHVYRSKYKMNALL